MLYSALICTRNSSRTIEDALIAIVSLGGREKLVEAIIVDYESSDMTIEISQRILSKSGIPLKLIRCNVPGKSEAMTLGMNAASGDIVLIIDDDNIVHFSFIDALEKVFADETIGCVGTNGIIDSTLVQPPWFQKFKGAYAVGTPGLARNGEINWLWGAGSAIRLDAWRKLVENGFRFANNPSRSASSLPIDIGGEDVELAMAIKLIGFRLNICSEAKYIHKFPQSRLTEQYLLDNARGVSRSTAVHSIYRIVGWGITPRYAPFAWVIDVARSAAISLFLALGSLPSDRLSARYFYSVGVGIILGAVALRGRVPALFASVRKLKK